MSNKTRSAGDLTSSPPDVTRPITPALVGMACLVLSLCAPGWKTAAAEEPGQSAFQYVYPTAYSSPPAARPSPSPSRSTLIVVSDEDRQAGQPGSGSGKAPLSPPGRATATDTSPSGTSPSAPTSRGDLKELRSRQLGSTSLFSGLPEVQSQQSPPAPLTPRGPAASGTTSSGTTSKSPSEPAPFTRLRRGSTEPAASTDRPASSSKGGSLWSQLFGMGQAETQSRPAAQTTAPVGAATRDAKSPGTTGAAPREEETSASGHKPIRLPATLTADQEMSGLWGQMSAKDGAPAVRAAAGAAGNNGMAGTRGAAQGSPQAARTAPDAEAISSRLTGLIHQFTAANVQPAQTAPAPGGARPAVAPPSEVRTASAAQPSQESEPLSNLWLPMTMTHDGRGQIPSAAAATNKMTTEEPPSLLMPFFYTNSEGGQQPQVAGGRASGEASPLVSRAFAGGEASPVAYLQDSDAEPLPQPQGEDDRLMPEDLGIPGEPARPKPSGEGADGEKQEGLAEAESLGEEPPDNSLQFLRFNTVLLEPGQRQFDIGLTYAFSENQFPIVITDMGTVIGVDEVEFKLRELEMPFEVRYGLFKRVQMFLGSSIGWSNTELTVANLEAFENDGGLGDIYGGLTIQFRDQTECSPYIVSTIGFTAPTGGDPFSAATGLAPSGPALGEGFWSVFGNVLFIRTYDPLTTFYGVGINHSFEHEYLGLDFKPGNEYSYFFGLGFAVNDDVTLSARFAGAYVEELDIDGERIPGTIQEPMSIRFATTIAKEKKIVEPFVEFGITEAALNSFFGVVCTY